MPPKKKQKTGPNSSAQGRDEELEARNISSAEAENGEEENEVHPRQPKDIPNDEWVVLPRPLFDCELEAALKDKEDENDEDDEDDEDDEELSVKIYNQANVDNDGQKKMLEPASDYPDWKWVGPMESWKILAEWRRRSGYCQPDYFGMYIYNDWYAYGIQELLENLLVKFDAGLKKKTDEARLSMWAVLGCAASWLTSGAGNDYIMSDDGDRAQEISGLVGTALLSGLASIEEAGELKADSKFLDLGIVITTFLHWSKDHEDYGIEEDAIGWREHAVAYFDRSGLGFDKGITGTKDLLKKFRGSSSAKPAKKADQWDWKRRLRMYSIKYGHGAAGKIGGTKFDITKMSKSDRVSYAFDHKDPLQGVSAKDLKDGLIEIG